jgi:protease-4
MAYYSFGREIANVLLRVVAVITTIIFIVSLVGAWSEINLMSDGSCNIAVLPIEGIIAPYGDFLDGELITSPSYIRSELTALADDDYIEGVLFEINSPGGTPVAAEHIAEEIAGLALPNVGLIGDYGASGAYLVAAATDHLIASPMSQVGSIGVTMSYIEESRKNEEEGLTFVELAAGPYKEAGNPNKPLTDDERARFERDLAIVHDAFIQEIANYRKLPVDEVRKVADGSGYTGRDALDRKLVDDLGGRATAKAYLASVLNIPIEEINFCERSRFDWLL